MITGTHTLLLIAHIIHAALYEESTMPASHARYAMYDALVRSPVVTLYPAANAEAIRALRARAPPEDPLSGVEDQCPVCHQAFVLGCDALVAPHDGIHWMHTHCYFGLLYRCMPWVILPRCPCCPVCIHKQFRELLDPQYQVGAEYKNKADDYSHALFAIPIADKLAADSCALLRNSLCILENLIDIHIGYCYTGKIYEVVIDLTGLRSAPEIISCIIANTINASILDVCTAALTPPSQDPLANQKLYTECLACLEGYESKEVFGPGIGFTYQVIAQLAYYSTSGEMADALAVLSIIKEPADKRLVRNTYPLAMHVSVKTKATVCAEVWSVDSAGAETCKKRPIVLVQHPYAAEYCEGSTDGNPVKDPVKEIILKSEAATLEYVKNELAVRGASLPAEGIIELRFTNTMEEPSAESGLVPKCTNTRLAITAASYFTEITYVHAEAYKRREFFNFNTKTPRKQTPPNTTLSLLAQLILGFSRHKKLSTLGFIFATQPFSAGLNVLNSLAQPNNKHETAAKDKIIKYPLEVISDVLCFLLVYMARTADERHQLRCAFCDIVKGMPAYET